MTRKEGGKVSGGRSGRLALGKTSSNRFREKNEPPLGATLGSGLSPVQVFRVKAVETRVGVRRADPAETRAAPGLSQAREPFS